MRQNSVALGSLFAVAALVGVAGAQPTISFFPGTPYTVTHTPLVVTVADVNKDGFDDALVGSSASQRVTILTGGPTENFTSVLTVGTANSLRSISVDDINADGCPDILTTHFGPSQIAYSFGDRLIGNVCPGTFGALKIQNVSGRPVGAVLGAFDVGTGADVVTAIRGTNHVTCLKNRGANQGFGSSGTSAGVGRRPIRIASADFNRDGNPDLVTVNSITRPVRDVSILFGKGACGFTQPADAYVVGAKASAVAITDFNKDGFPDIMVLNAGRATRGGDFSVSLLQNRTEIQAGKVVATGGFDQLPAVRVQCPLGRRGIPARCTPVALAAGDFNGDGLTDLAIAMRGVVRGSSTRGMVQYYAGAGDGRFEQQGRLTTPGRPTALAAGDFNNDGLTDLVVTEGITHTVRLLFATLAP